MNSPPRRPWSLAAALLASLAACADPGEPASGVYVGKAGDLFVAVVAADDEVTVYACDGTATMATPTRVAIHGDVVDGRGTITNPDTKFAADLAFADGGVSGSLDLGGDALDFTAAAATGKAGFWWGETVDPATTDEWAGGWVFDEAGDSRGAVINRNKGDATFFFAFNVGGTVALSDTVTLSPTKQIAPNPDVH